MVNEKITDFFIGGLLKEANIKFVPNGSDIKEINEALKTASKRGTYSVGHPEFTAKVNDFILVIEDKADINKQAKYCEKNPNKLDMSTDAIVNYAENGALHYAQHIVKNTNFKKIFAFGCSGDEKHHKIRPIFIDENKYKLLDSIENFKNFSEESINKYYKEIVLNEPSLEVLEVKSLLNLSKNLNKDLYKYGGVRNEQRPLVVSAILLALYEKLDIDSLNADHIKKDGAKIHDALCCNLQRVDVGDKREVIMHQFNFIKDNNQLNTYNEKLGKTPLRYFTEFIKEKVFPSISQSHEDILGFFYSEFIKFVGGDGQNLGIVLTPNHITELVCDLLDVKPSDKVLDPCAGTGGFLISAMNRMLNKVNTAEEKDFIKRNNIHGIEIKEGLFTIASTNMVLRGDGKSNLILEDFFKVTSEELQNNNFTVGMMNPPYSQGSVDNPQLYEINFIKHLLDSLSVGGRCAVIVPQPIMMGHNDIRKEILKHHTLEGVITLNKDTSFYKIGTNPCIAIFTSHQKHPKDKRCKFINFDDDGYELRKHVGIVATPRAIERKEHLLKCWRDEKDPDSEFMVKSKIKYTDEWLHSFYYFDDTIPTEKEFIESIEKYLSFEFSMSIKDKTQIFKED